MSAAQHLIEAVHAGDQVAVGFALESGADPNTLDPARFHERPVLTVAAERGDSEVVRQLLIAGADPSTSSGYDWTALRAAIHEGHPDVVSVLLEMGVDPNAPRERGSMLEAAVDAARHHPRRGAVHVLAMLLRAGAKVRVDDEAAIVHAVEFGSAPVVLRLLIEHGDEPDQRRSDGVPILVLAVRRRDHAAVDCLVYAGADVDARDGRGRTALMHAVELGLNAIAVTLLNAGADPDLNDDGGSTALAIARAWQRPNLHLMLNEMSVRPEGVDVRRTFMELVPRSFELRGSRDLFDLWSRLIDHTIDDLGDSEYATLVGHSVEESRLLAARLREQVAPGAAPAAWCVTSASSGEVDIVRYCLLNLAYGPPMEMPDGLSRIEVKDLFEELAAQLRG